MFSVITHIIQNIKRKAPTYCKLSAYSLCFTDHRWLFSFYLSLNWTVGRHMCAHTHAKQCCSSLSLVGFISSLQNISVKSAMTSVAMELNKHACVCFCVHKQHYGQQNNWIPNQIWWKKKEWRKHIKLKIKSGKENMEKISFYRSCFNNKIIIN